jgi:dihydrofolate synthase/folylpolyglutamate synthase
LNRFPFAVRAEFAGGFGARGLALGVAVGREVARAAGIDRVDPDKLAEVLASVRNPGRGSVHRTLGGRRVIVDSPVTGEGLRVALASARSVLGGEPDLILVSLCADKDLEGFGAVLAGLRERTVFVSLPDSHLRFGAPPRWAGRHVTDKDLPALLNCGDVLAVGTALFTGAVLDVLGVPTESLLRRPAGRGASRPLRSAATPVDTNGGR